MSCQLSGVVRALLWEHKYTGPMCHEEFGVGLSWYSDFMRGAHKNPNAATLQLMYEKLTGEPLIPHHIAHTVGEREPVSVGTGGQSARMAGKFAPKCPPPPSK